MQKIYVIMLSCLLIFTAVEGACTKAPAPSVLQKTLPIGVSAVYTGALGAIGKSSSNGILDHIRWIASQGGIKYKDAKSGQIEQVATDVYWEDNQYDVAKSVSAYKRLKAFGVKAIASVGSSPGEACAPSASRDKLPYFSSYAVASPAGYAPKPQYYWASHPTVAELIAGPLKWLVQEKLRGIDRPKVGLIVIDQPSSRPLANPGLMDSYVASIGGELIGIEWAPVLLTDSSVQLTRLVSGKGAQGIAFAGTLDQMVVISKDMRRLGIDPAKVPLVASCTAWDESLLQFKEVEGMYGQVVTALPDEDVPGMKLLKEVATWANRPPQEINTVYIQGYCGALVLTEAIKRALEKDGYDSVMASGDSIRQQMATFQPVDSGGLMPDLGVKYPDIEPFFCNGNVITQAQGGKFVKVSNWVPFDLIKGAIEAQ